MTKIDRLGAMRPIIAGLLAVSVVMAVVFAAAPAGAQDLRTGEPGDLIVFIDRDDIPENSICTVFFENNESSHPGNHAIARSSLERETEVDFEDGNGETVELTIESDGLLFAAVRLGDTRGTSTAVDFTCEQAPATTTTTIAPATTDAPTTTVAVTTTTVAPTTTVAVTTTTVSTEVGGQVEEQPAAVLAVTGRTHQAALGFALLSVGLGILLLAVSAIERKAAH
jgi:hypothetical protein